MDVNPPASVTAPTADPAGVAPVHAHHARPAPLRLAKPTFHLPDNDGSESEKEGKVPADLNGPPPDMSGKGGKHHRRVYSYGHHPSAAPLSPMATWGSATSAEVPYEDAFPFLKDREEQLGWWRWLADVQVEKHGKRRLLVSLVFYAICGYINIIFCNLADLRRAELIKRGIAPGTTLPDLGHDLIPHLSIPHLPDYFIITLTALTVGLIINHKHRLGLIRRFLYVHGTLLLFRSLTIISTTLPDPQKKCAEKLPVEDIFAPVNPLMPVTCGDMMFSGHTVMLTILAMIWTDYGPQIAWVRRGIWTIAALGMLSLLAMRYHYTIDIMIALYITQRGWRWYGYLAANQHLREQEPIVAFLERRSSEADFLKVAAALRESRAALDATVTEVTAAVAAKADEARREAEKWGAPIAERMATQVGPLAERLQKEVAPIAERISTQAERVATLMSGSVAKAVATAPGAASKVVEKEKVAETDANTAVVPEMVAASPVIAVSPTESEAETMVLLGAVGAAR
ncbi:hypothetical protein AMAG_11289 [Allomyces macrogynus ATCC 38327]|uniref:Sphingomyelin synthase-like domain-containing protein n=1 Tax=Allomyces macrogynus (strain ATCC 38327) TaxID=578462 RepID=A0A0L0SW38_ALLM3|nr:hypothetical protein AMAG_11289 [Allomyces macrogynus ATCC 38327]|eukprot:KNE66798.1 hypothetical protein AMAG_11289 [Allomyces macrogynus ATCC 38327]